MELNKSLLKGSLVLLIAFNLYNLLNFIFHFGMARLLSVADYGILLTLYSMIYLFGSNFQREDWKSLAKALPV